MAAKSKSTTSTKSSTRSGVTDAITSVVEQYLDTVEKTSHRVAEWQEGIGRASRTPILETIGRAQADVTREVTGAYVRAARKVVA